jgi:hypothetical protein
MAAPLVASRARTGGARYATSKAAPADSAQRILGFQPAKKHLKQARENLK